MENLSQLPKGAQAAVQSTQDGGGEDATRRAAEEQMRQDVLVTLLDTGARERCT
jgi:DNA-binding TFAR19-related protein (PDSD5 family)